MRKAKETSNEDQSPDGKSYLKLSTGPRVHRLPSPGAESWWIRIYSGPGGPFYQIRPGVPDKRQVWNYGS